MFKNKLR